jgi:hypothetical protein
MASNVHYNAGSKALTSGIFTFHHDCGRAPVDVVLIRGDRLKPCKYCTDGGSFTLKMRAPYLGEDPEFLLHRTTTATD